MSVRDLSNALRAGISRTSFLNLPSGTAAEVEEAEDANADDLEAQFESFMTQDEADGGVKVEETATVTSCAAVIEVQRL